MANPNGWTGVDLDGTLARFEEGRGIDFIGDPVPLMRERVLRWVTEGRDVRIFTTRASGPAIQAASQTRLIQNWLEKHGMPRLRVTARKDFRMLELWDDRAVQVMPNTGVRADGKP